MNEPKMNPMSSRPFSVPGRLLAVLVLLTVASCNVVPPVQSDATRYYILTGPSLAPASDPAMNATLRVGLKAIEVAPYLRKGSLVVRTGENEVAFPDEARWAEPIDQQIAGALRQRLSAAPTVARVIVPPFPFEEPRDFDVSVRVLHSEGAREGSKTTARFAAAIEISSTGPDARVVIRKTFVAPDAAWDGRDFARLAALLSDAVNALGQEIVTALPEKK